MENNNNNETLQIKGKFVKSLNEIGGTSQNGNEWKKKDLVIETIGQYPKKIAFSVWNEKIHDIETLKEGEELTVFFNVESREYNEKFYTDLKAWKIQTSDLPF